ncbi:MAG: hypothetical protein IJT43_09465 [Stomatobaculum sp.]|nr:hypothetical protein [Stomatobaculum sp.]
MKMKHLFGAALACVLGVCMTIPAFAGVWKLVDGVWHYDYTGRGVKEGWLKDQWAWIDGNHDRVSECYYFDADGNMLADTTVDGYQLNSNGQWVVDGIVQTKIEGASEVSGLLTADLLHTEPAESGYIEFYDTAETSSGLTWNDGVRYMGSVSHLATEVFQFDKDYQSMTIVFAPEAGQNVSTTGRVTVAGVSSGKTLYSSAKFGTQSEPITATSMSKEKEPSASA